MSNRINLVRFKCDLCEKEVEQKDPYECELRVGGWFKEFEVCCQCYTPVEKTIREQDLNLFKKAWRKFFGGKA